VIARLKVYRKGRREGFDEKDPRGFTQRRKEYKEKAQRDNPFAPFRFLFAFLAPLRFLGAFA
jgi:hypothetical protein